MILASFLAEQAGLSLTWLKPQTGFLVSRLILLKLIYKNFVHGIMNNVKNYYDLRNFVHEIMNNVENYYDLRNFVHEIMNNMENYYDLRNFVHGIMNNMENYYDLRNFVHEIMNNVENYYDLRSFVHGIMNNVENYYDVRNFVHGIMNNVENYYDLRLRKLCKILNHVQNIQHWFYDLQTNCPIQNSLQSLILKLENFFFQIFSSLILFHYAWDWVKIVPHSGHAICGGKQTTTN